MKYLFLILALANCGSCPSGSAYGDGSRPGHRAAISNKYIENSFASLRELLDKGAPHIEFDIRYTEDHQLVVFHDDTACRTTGRNHRISKTAYHNLPRLLDGSKIPLVWEYIYMMQGTTLEVYFDVKTLSARTLPMLLSYMRQVARPYMYIQKDLFHSRGLQKHCHEFPRMYDVENMNALCKY